VRLADGQCYLSFCSNDYLGLANHPDVLQAAAEGLQRYGCGSGASHLITGHSQAHHLLEEELAAFLDVPAVLLYSSGYMANLGVMNVLLDKQDFIYQDKLNHASLIDAGRAANAVMKRYLHNDLQSLEKLLRASNNKAGLIVSDAVFSMDGDIVRLDEMLALLAGYPHTALMLDDAHGFGILGTDGSGSPAHFGIKHAEIDIYMATLGKALGVAGAFVAASADFIEALIQFSRTYIYTTAMPPAQAEALRMSLKLLHSEPWRRHKLMENTLLFKKLALQNGIPLGNSDTPVQPILLHSTSHALNLQAYLKKQGMLTIAIRPPTVPPDTSRLRITLSAEHGKQHIAQLVKAISEGIDQL